MNKHQNIWYISKYIAPPSAAKVSARGFLILKEFVRLGHKASLFTSDSNHLINPPELSTAFLHQNEEGVDVHWIRTKKYEGSRSLKRMISWLDFELRLFLMPKKDLLVPDIIIVSSLSLLTIINGFILRRRYCCKLVFEVRDIWPLVLTEAGKINRLNPFIFFLAYLEKLAYKKADILVGTMPNLSKRVTEVLGKKRDVYCIPQGVDTSLLHPPLPLSEDFVAKYIPKDKFIICHAGSIGADNALETLMSCARLMKDRTDIHFLIVGEGHLKAKFQKETSDLANITFAPRVEKMAVQSLLALSDVVYFSVHKSQLWTYGQSLNKIIDYMLSSKPIVASYSGFPSMINEANCGSYIEAEDINALRIEFERMAAMTPEQRNEIGKRGREWVLKNRQYQTLATHYLNIIDGP